MNVLVDTSVWSFALRRKNTSTHKRTSQLHDLIDSGQALYLNGLILTEILRHVAHRDQLIRIKDYLESFPLLELDRNGYLEAAALSSKCRSKGIQCIVADVIIAQTAINHNCYLLTADRDFEGIARYSNLQLI